MLIGISAPPASGKTFSMRNLDSSKLAILNTDMKKVPKKMFTDGGEKLLVIDVPTYQSFSSLLKKAEESDREYIAVDTFTKLISRIEEYVTQKFGASFNKWVAYKEEIVKTIDFMKKSKKVYFIINHTTVHTNEATGLSREIVKVSGSLAKEGGILAMLDINMHAMMRLSDDGDIEFVFDTQCNPSNDARSPMGMFENRFISNDLSIVLGKANEYY